MSENVMDEATWRLVKALCEYRTGMVTDENETIFAMLGSDARVVVLRNAAEMLVRGTVDEGVKE